MTITEQYLKNIQKEYWFEFKKAEEDFKKEMKASQNKSGKDGASHYTGNGYGVISARLASTRNYLMAIDESIKRMENGNYGICKGCKREIPIKRLQIIPHTQFCVKCCNIIEKQ